MGIDLGTTHSLVAYADEAGPRVLHDQNGQSLLPSVVRFDESGQGVQAIGQDAASSAVLFPTRTVRSSKRLMGRSMQDLDPQETEALGYALAEGEQSTARIRIGDRLISPQEVGARVLEQLKQTAESALGRPVSKAVITVPAYFDDAQRQATRDAARFAGLDAVRILNEPTAAAMAYGLGPDRQPNHPTPSLARSASGSVSLSTKFNPDACDTSPAGDSDDAADPSHASRTIAVFDLGGGTFDLSILRLEQTEHGAVDQVLATAGDTHLGGDDIDRMLSDLFLHEAREQFGQDLRFMPETRQALRNLAEATKIRLSEHESAEVEIDLGDGRLYQRSIKRDEFNRMIQPWIDRTLKPCQDAMQAAKLAPDAIDQVVLVGGSTRLPAVREAVSEWFGQPPYTALDPDRVVALGAAVQASVLMGITRDRLLLDVIPLSLGIETLGGAVAKLISANSTIPARATERFSTHVDGQTNVQINVYQGERELVQDCRLLGRFELTGLPPMPAGLPKLLVHFVVDANGVLTVQAEEERSGRRAHIQLVPHHGLTRDEVDRIEQESFQHAKQDMDRHRLIDLRNQARMDLRAIENQRTKVGDQLEAEEAKTLETKIDAVRAMLGLESPDLDAFAEALTAMDHGSIRLAELAIAMTLKDAGTA